jgi:parallel beta-helix repeat protein
MIARKMCKLGSYLFLLTILLLMPGLAVATDHSGPIPTDEIWDPGDNPHIIVDNVTVPSGVTLTIMPGVEVRFNGNKYIYVDGIMNAPGTSSDKIIFTRNTATNGRGLYFYAGSVGDFTHCIMEHCNYGVRGNSTAAVSLSNCVLQKNTYGFYGDQCAPTLGTNTFQGNGTGLYLKTVTLFSVSSQVIEDNDTGIHFYYCTKPEVDATNTITHNKIYGVRFEDCSLPEIYADVTDGGTGIYFESCTNVGTIDNVTLKDNIGPYGALYMRDSGIFTLGTNNTITGNSWPLSIGAGSFPDTSSAIPSSGNTTNAIKVTGGSSNKTGVWPKFSAIPYIVTGNLTINTPGALTIEEGVEARISSGVYIYIKSALTASGTSDNPITFTRQSGSHWGGLRFYNGSISTLSHCTIEYAKNGIYADSDPDISLANCAFQYNDTGIYFYYCTSPTPTVDSTNTIRDSKTYGIRFYNCSSPGINVQADIANSGTGICFDNCSDLGTIDNLTLEDNTDSAIMVNNSGAFTLGPNNTITGNSWPLSIGAGSFPDASSVIPVSGNTTNAIKVTGVRSDKTGVWPKFSGLNYIVAQTFTISSGGSLTIDPGVEVLFDGGQYINVSGTLNASGTYDNLIIFTRNGDDVKWGGLRFQNGSSGAIAYCNVEYGTYGVYVNNSSPIISSCMLAKNDKGVYCIYTASPQISNCNITGNGYGVYSQSSSNPVISGSSDNKNTISDNKQYGVYADSTVTIDAEYNYWGDPSGPNHSGNSGGKGDWVSDYVDYDPFETTP